MRHSHAMNDKNNNAKAPIATSAHEEEHPNIVNDQEALKDQSSDTSHGQMTSLDPSYILVMRLTAFIWALLLSIPIFIGDAILADAGHIKIFVISAPISLILLIMVFILPRRRYKRWGYDMGEKQIQIVRGYLFFTDTIVPFSRVQHIDIAQGPILRIFGLSRLILHTAGTHNSTVILPGLKREIAEEIRDTIRQYIKADML